MPAQTIFTLNFPLNIPHYGNIDTQRLKQNICSSNINNKNHGVKVQQAKAKTKIIHPKLKSNKKYHTVSEHSKIKTQEWVNTF